MSQDLLGMFFFSEILIGSSIMLVVSHRGQNASEAALKYAIIMIISSVFYCLGITIIITLTGTTNLFTILNDTARLSLLIEKPPILMFAIACIIIAFSIKVGIFPFHGWLPDVYVASSPTVIGFFCLKPIALVLTFFNLLLPLFQIYPTNTIIFLLMGLGLISLLFGALFAYPQKDYMRMLAYCQISVFGMLFFVVGLSLTQLDAPTNFSVGLIYLLNSTLMKTGLFLSLGVILTKTETRNSDSLGGLFGRLRITGISYILCALSLVGLPPLSGFQAKWLIFNLTYLYFFNVGGIFLALSMLILLACFSLVELAYLIRAFHQIFFGPPPVQLTDTGDVSPLTWIPPLVLAAIGLVLGLYPEFLFSLIIMN